MFVIEALKQLSHVGTLTVTVAQIEHGVASIESSLNPDSTWVQAVVRDLVDRGFLTVLEGRACGLAGAIGYTTTSRDHIDWSKARLRIEPSIIHALPRPDSAELVNNNYGEQFFGHASKFEENHYDTTPAAVTPAAPRSSVTQEVNAPVHSDDFRSVNWFGVPHEFTTNAARVVELLWDHWKRGTPTVSQDCIREKLEIDSRLQDVFRGNPAWGTMIVSGSRKGTVRLAEPGTPTP